MESDKEILAQFQEGCRAVPLFTAEQGSALRLCVVVRDAPGPADGFFVLLGDEFDTSIYLGCVIDAGGHVHRWIELWVQNLANVSTTPESFRASLSNSLLDERWLQRARTAAALDRGSVLQIGPEPGNHPPIFFDLEVTSPVHPVQTDSQAPWELCRDDPLLAEHGLPTYSQSLARYLYVRGGAPTFLPVTPGSPENASTAELPKELGPLVPFNPGGGLMTARSFAPLRFEEYLEVLGGDPWKGVQQGEKVFHPGGVYSQLRTAEAIRQGGLFSSKRGLAGRLLETFYLKLELVAQAFRVVSGFVQGGQLPFLNLGGESFRVALADTSPTLPFLWTAKLALAVPGTAVPLPIPAAKTRYFAEPGLNRTSIYRPYTADLIVKANGDVRIRQVISQEDGSVILEGTISAQERIAISQTDLFWIRLTLSAGRVDFYANPTDGVAQGERRFRTIPQHLPENLALAIRSAEGVRFQNVPFETLPLLSSPCDLYSLAVLGVRTLLVNDENTLPVALDELFSFARAIDSQEGAEIRAIAEADPRWSASLGPQRLLKAGSTGVDEALTQMPATLWWDAVALLIRCFPGTTKNAFCANFGVAPAGALQAVFEPAIFALDTTLLRARAHLFADWKYNSEVNAVIHAALQRDNG